MMKLRRIQTEDANDEQWRWLSRYAYPANINRFFTSRSRAEPTAELADYISGSIRQGQQFFESASAAPLDIQPLLLYYGAINLASGAAAMVSGSRLAIAGHGLRLQRGDPSLTRIADLEVVPVGATTGALQLLVRTFSNVDETPAGIPWTVEEILASIPDLKQPFVECFPSSEVFALPVEQLKHDGIAVERIPLKDFGTLAPHAALASVPGFATAYIRPQVPQGGDKIILRKRVASKEIGTRSIMGAKWLVRGHAKGGRLCEPGQLGMMIMGLFALGHVSRYYPELWNPFVRTDATGERLVIERFLLTCSRFLPNLVLNELEGERLQFVSAADSAPQEMPSTEEELRRLVRKEVRAAIAEERA